MFSQYIIFIIIAIFALGLGYFLRRLIVESKIKTLQLKEKDILNKAEAQAQTIKSEAQLRAREELLRMRSEFERETKETKKELQDLERRLTIKEENLEKKVSLLDTKEQEMNKKVEIIQTKEKRLEEQQTKYAELETETKRRLEKIAGLSTQEAKEMLMGKMVEEAKHDVAKKIKEIEDEAKDQAEKRAKRIIGMAIQRYAGEHVSEQTVAVVGLPSDDMKGRIIGREGRNIKSIEAATGVDLIIDDTPEAVIISSFDPVRRQVAKISLERLILDGRIHPTRVEEVVQKVQQEVEQSIKEAGEQALLDVGIHGVHSEILKLIGALKYRTSYSQNVYEHSKEVAYICGMMAAELGLNVKQARRAGLLHDIGKAIDHSVEGSHAIIGGDFAKKYGEAEAIVHAIRTHHEDEKPETILAYLVQAADALSGARPGARREILEGYVKRLEDLERIADSFVGVEKSYAIQAGREVRVLVQQEKISDEQAIVLSKDIAKKIEEELSYPGQIRVTVIRETRATEVAK